MPPKAPLGDDSGVFRSAWASNQTSARSEEAMADTAPRATPQSPPTTIVGSETSASSRSSASRTRTRELSRRTPLPSDSPASSGTSSGVQEARGRSPAIAAAPSTSCIARDEPDPCHCGTTTKRLIATSSRT